MELNFCFPREMQEMKNRNIPVVIAGGTVEYHGAHCAYGCDTLVAEGLLKKLAEKKELCIAPSIYYSPSSYAVADEKSGTVHIEEDAFEDYLYYIFYSMLSSGLRNIYVVIHHQFEQESLMPMTLSYMKAAKKATMRYLEETKGEGWWGSESYRDYYSELDGADNPFAWIQIISTMTVAVQNATGYDHAGEFESSLLMALAPETVDLARIGEKKHWFTEAARKANPELGERMAALSVESLAERIK